MLLLHHTKSFQIKKLVGCFYCEDIIGNICFITVFRDSLAIIYNCEVEKHLQKANTSQLTGCS